MTSGKVPAVSKGRIIDSKEKKADSKSASGLAPQPRPRCSWPGKDPLYCAYHDEEWGVPLADDDKLFEFLVLETMQAGLSWITVLRKRAAFRKAFDQFNPHKIARYKPQKIEALMADAGIIRNRQKIEAACANARAFLAIKEELGSFADYSLQFVGGQPKINRWRSNDEVPAITPESEAFSKDLKRRGFKFVGPTTVYAHMQATGMVNDHLVSCFRYKELT